MKQDCTNNTCFTILQVLNEGKALSEGLANRKTLSTFLIEEVAQHSGYKQNSGPSLPLTSNIILSEL